MGPQTLKLVFDFNSLAFTQRAGDALWVMSWETETYKYYYLNRYSLGSRYLKSIYIDSIISIY